jgi:hypothetical protein
MINSFMTNQNPLLPFCRQPKIYLALPSDGLGYTDESLNMPITKELPVFAMTAQDEILLKTPDALMNGEAVTTIIKSCVPNILDPWQMPASDIDAVLIAIRIASSGGAMSITSECPKCKHENDYEIDLVQMLDKSRNRKFNSIVKLKNGLEVELKSLTYLQVNQISIKTFKEQKMMMGIANANMSEEEKIRLFTNTVIHLSNIDAEMLQQCVKTVKVNGATVDKPEYVQEWLSNIDSETYEAIKKALDDAGSKIFKEPFKAVCTECQHEWPVPIELDHSNFFA